MTSLPCPRTVEPIDLEGAETPPPPTDEPIFERVNPRSLLVDEAYQRGLSDKGLAQVRRIAREWDWRRFKPPVVAFADGGLQIIDGQHTAIAAASRGIEAIPVMVVEAPDIEDRAKAFVGHNRDRLQVSAMQLHHAAVAAGDDDAVTIEQVCARAGVNLVRSAFGGYPWKPGDSVAVGAIAGLVDRRGAMTARQILQVLVEAQRAPVSANDIKAAELLFAGDDYRDQLEPLAGERGAAIHDVAQAILTLGDAAEKEAKVFAAAQCVPLWKAIGITWFKKARKRRKAA